jgi:hypothetical protein
MDAEQRNTATCVRVLLGHEGDERGAVRVEAPIDGWSDR